MSAGYEGGIVVSGLAITPVKGTRLRSVDHVLLDRGGVRENRRFYVIDERARMLNGKQLGELNAVIADYCEAERGLKLTFPDGQIVEGGVDPGAPIETRFFSRTLTSRIVRGPWSQALSGWVGQPLRLVEADRDGGAVDRGSRGAASLISRASLTRLAEAAGQSDVDPRRFRMLIEVDGVAAHAEDRWVGRKTRVGAAVIAWRGHVGRCLVTSRHPETGDIDLPTLDVLGTYRRESGATEPLPFGIYGQVLTAGTIRVGDCVLPDG